MLTHCLLTQWLRLESPVTLNTVTFLSSLIVRLRNNRAVVLKVPSHGLVLTFTESFPCTRQQACPPLPHPDNSLLSSVPFYRRQNGVQSHLPWRWHQDQGQDSDSIACVVSMAWSCLWGTALHWGGGLCLMVWLIQAKIQFSSVGT